MFVDMMTMGNVVDTWSIFVLSMEVFFKKHFLVYFQFIHDATTYMRWNYGRWEKSTSKVSFVFNFELVEQIFNFINNIMKGRSDNVVWVKMKIKRHQQLCNHLIKLSNNIHVVFIHPFVGSLFWLFEEGKHFHARLQRASDTCLLRPKGVAFV